MLRLKIEELKQWQAMAWRRIADPQITPFERRKILDHIKESDFRIAPLFNENVRAKQHPV